MFRTFKYIFPFKKRRYEQWSVKNKKTRNPAPAHTGVQEAVRAVPASGITEAAEVFPPVFFPRKRRKGMTEASRHWQPTEQKTDKGAKFEHICLKRTEPSPAHLHPGQFSERPERCKISWTVAE